MVSKIHRSRRTHGALIATFVLAAVAVAPNAAAAPQRHTRTFHAHATVTARVSVKASAVATATASAGSPAVTAQATARGTAFATASATRSASATVRRHAATRHAARSQARHAARATAHRRAAARARVVARSRALAAAKATAHRRALAAATAAAAARASAAANPTCLPLAKDGGGTWNCTFDDEFNSDSLDRTKWLPITTAANGIANGPSCWVDTPDNISESDGTLNLTVREEAEPFTCQSPRGAFSTRYSSAQVATYRTFGQTYGRYAIRASFPAATVAGLQSSLWMWPQDNIATGLTGEIDIAEEYSIGADRAVPYLHYAYDPATVDPSTGTNVVTNNYCMIDDVHAFHEYALEWTPTSMKILFDGQTCLVDNYSTLGASPFDQQYFIALTAALGVGNNAYDPATTPLPATTRIDWVRAWS